MPVPSYSRTSGIALKRKLEAYKTYTGRIKDDSDTFIGSSVINLPDIREFQARNVNFLAQLDILVANASTNGFLEYVRVEENATTYDLSADHATFRVQLDATITWVATNFPKDATGGWADYVTGVDSSPQPRPLTAPQMTAFKSQMSLLSTTIK